MIDFPLLLFSERDANIIRAEQLKRQHGDQVNKLNPLKEPLVYQHLISGEYFETEKPLQPKEYIEFYE